MAAGMMMGDRKGLASTAHDTGNTCPFGNFMLKTIAPGGTRCCVAGVLNKGRNGEGNVHGEAFPVAEGIRKVDYQGLTQVRTGLTPSPDQLIMTTHAGMMFARGIENVYRAIP